MNGNTDHSFYRQNETVFEMNCNLGKYSDAEKRDYYGKLLGMTADPQKKKELELKIKSLRKE